MKQMLSQSALREEMDTGGSRSALLIAGAFLLLTALLPVLLSISAPQAGQQRALVFAPGTGLPEVFAALRGTGVQIVRANEAGSVVVAAFPTSLSLSDLWDRGVLLSLDPWLAGGCQALAVKT